MFFLICFFSKFAAVALFWKAFHIALESFSGNLQKRGSPPLGTEGTSSVKLIFKMLGAIAVGFLHAKLILWLCGPCFVVSAKKQEPSSVAD